MKVTKPILKNAFPYMPDGGADGLFCYIPNVPWAGTYNDNLDMLLYLQHGEKPVSPAVMYYMRKDEELYEIDDTQKLKLGALISTLYSKRWERLWEVYNAEYNPIENYNMRETESDIGKDTTSRSASDETQTDTTRDVLSTMSRQRDEHETNSGETSVSRDERLSHTESKTNTLLSAKETSDINTEKQSQTAVNTGETSQNVAGKEDSKIYGFNSGTGANDRSVDTSNNSDTNTTNTASGETSTSRDGTFTEQSNDAFSENVSNADTRTGSDTQSDSRARALSGNARETAETGETGTASVNRVATGTDETNTSRDRALTRRGNIGVTTTQQMLQSQIDLWIWNFFNEVIQDVSKFLCLGVY